LKEIDVKTEIERLDQERMRNLELYLFGVILALVLSITRYFFRLGGLNSQPIGRAVLIGLFFSVFILMLSTIKSARLRREIKSDPSVEAALSNELVRTLDVQSWKAAYFGAIGTTIFFAITWYFYPICDPVMVALTSIIAGIGAYQATFYLKYRSA
jgi:hypothetical protein